VNLDGTDTRDALIFCPNVEIFWGAKVSNEDEDNFDLILMYYDLMPINTCWTLARKSGLALGSLLVQIKKTSA
jgi:hypothetical protein